jgi:membrane protein implicated in regulation of membrane protease activity
VILPSGGLDPWIWAILGLVLAAAELFLPGAYLIFIAFGLLITAAATGLGHLGLVGQLAVLPAACLGSCLVGYVVYRRFRGSDGPHQLNTGFDWLIGQTAKVVEPIADGSGRIQIGDTFFPATGPDAAIGATVRVTGMRDGTAAVVPLPHERRPATSATGDRDR